ncbi:NADP-dependent oxidoreductase [Glycomyces tarimensis]
MTTTMRAIVQDRLGRPEVLKIAEVPRPEPALGEILVKVHAAGANPADFKVREDGSYDGARPPYTLGWDVSGTVEAVGIGVRIFEPGDEVYGMLPFPSPGGGYSEYVAAPSRSFDFKPSRLSHVEAAALPLAGLTAQQALVDTAGIRAGQQVLVHAAAGGVGHLAVQIAKAHGAFVIATASAAKHEFLRSIGADRPFDYTTTDFAEALNGIDVVLDAIGGEDYVARSAAVLRDGGKLVTIVNPAELPEAHRDRIASGFMIVEPDWSGMRELSRLVEEGSLSPTVSKTFPLEEAAAAHEALESGRTIGKIVLTVD